MGSDSIYATSPDQLSVRLCLRIGGLVQGVGFRPFVHRLAHRLELAGWVQNASDGVCIEIEGALQQIDQFLRALQRDLPPMARIDRLERQNLPLTGELGFTIRDSDASGERRVGVLPDLATCPDCLAEITDPSNRRYQYPFTNCTHCGPRLSIIHRLPYDRGNTSMERFSMCAACDAEYHDPQDRRFHAQPNACPDCGPQLALWDTSGNSLATRHSALLQACDWVSRGGIVAVKGLGGFHLMVDARNDLAVGRLRERKRRPAKPLAVMFPDLESARATCRVGEREAVLLTSPQAPIVILSRLSSGDPLAEGVAPGNPEIGAMLPYTPLHHLMMQELGFPLVATSGNLSGEPICIDEAEAISRLGQVADRFLVHDRPIRRPIEDSVLRVVMGAPMMLRGARGFAPISLPLTPTQGKGPKVLAMGGHLKNTIALTLDGQAIVGQHVGDLTSTLADEAFRDNLDGLRALYDIRVERVACDKHPDYRSSEYGRRYARPRHLPLISVQHHHAHVAACLAEHGLTGSVLGVCWDGTGLGEDGRLWGGEFLCANRIESRRVGHLRAFRLPGGEVSAREPRRVAAGLLAECYPDRFRALDLPFFQYFPEHQRVVLAQMLDRGLNCPWTTSVGRLFDAVASLGGLSQVTSFEGEAATALQYAATGYEEVAAYPLPTMQQTDTAPWVANWAPLVDQLMQDVDSGRPIGEIAAAFHKALAELVVEGAKMMAMDRVVLTGGCFQNALLLRMTAERLRRAGMGVWWPQRVPPNDGGLSLGQATVAHARALVGD
ncbi:MAG: carbamoyltransferase HypF [Pseudomonadota bacterium]|nr:carbamoyltransferase HypF [Pseudomonadota bacterium]